MCIAWKGISAIEEDNKVKLEKYHVARLFNASNL